jgi:hypothetical protein
MGGMRLFLPVECSFESLFDQALSDAKHGIDTDGEALGYPLIRPGRTIRIGFQQDIGMSYLVCCGFPFPRQLGQLSAFLISKTYDILLVHGTLRLIARYWLRRNNNLLTCKNKADKALVAHHYTEAGLSELAITYWQQAGERAVQHSAYVEAIGHFTKDS